MWIVAWSIPFNSLIEEFDSYEKAKEIFDNYSEGVSNNGETLYIAEAKLYKK